MTDLVVETTQLRKEFWTRSGPRVAVHDLDLAVPVGGVHGFLGPNGSGKTTTIRMLLGLSHATRGEMRVFGQRVPDHLPTVLRRVGAVVESPKFTPNLSGRRNLLLLSRSIGVSDAQVDSAIETVGLHWRDRDSYKAYSLGMRQRLAIAATLLKQPDLLILDEPTNGLDPAGIREIRETIRGLGEQGVTILLSSHILAEVQQVCSSVTIIGNGRLLASGNVHDLLAKGVDSHHLEVPNPRNAQHVLQAAGLQAAIDGQGVRISNSDPETINRALTSAGIWLHSLTPVRPDLESVFLDLTNDNALGRESPR